MTALFVDALKKCCCYKDSFKAQWCPIYGGIGKVFNGQLVMLFVYSVVILFVVNVLVN